jgi:hypothetical protein
MTEKTNAKTTSRPARPAPRRAATGDVAPKETAAAIEQFVSTRPWMPPATPSHRRQRHRRHPRPHDTHSIAETLQAIMAGASPDDAAILRKALLAEDEAV